MPSTVDALLRGTGLPWAGAVRWRERPALGGPRVYLVARAEDPTALPPNLAAPLSPAALEQLLARCPVTVDGVLASPRRLAARLAAFWLPDEPVIYIGKAGSSVADRVSAYYHTPVGAARGPLPFANLQWRPGVRKRHGLAGYRRLQPRPAPRCPDAWGWRERSG